MESAPGMQSLSRAEKRRSRKKLRRQRLRQQQAAKGELLECNDEQFWSKSEDDIEAKRLVAEKAEYDEQKKLWLQREEIAVEDSRIRQEGLKKLEEEWKRRDVDDDAESTDEDRPPEIIWQGNEIIVNKRRVRGSAKPHATPKGPDLGNLEEKSASNPLPPQSAAFEAHTKDHQLQSKSEHTPAFGTEQDKTNCPFHIKTGVCRFGVRCSRLHVYPDHSFTLLVRNMYAGPGLTSEYDEGLEISLGQAFSWRRQALLEARQREKWNVIHSEEELAQHYEEFYEDVHPEFLQFGELVNFKVCNNTSLHLRGNVYIHYQTEAAAQAAYSAMNGRFYAGKQITCEFVGVTRWRTALCGEYMKFNYRLCSHGTACNFLHCFRNPHGEYDWADWDTKPPRYWVVTMAKLLGREAYFYDEHDDHSDDGPRYGHSRSARRESRSRERCRYRYRSRDRFDHVSSHRTHRRHGNGSERSGSDSDEPSRRLSRKDRFEHHRRLNYKEEVKSMSTRGYSTTGSRADSRDSFQKGSLYEIDGTMRQKYRRSPESRDQHSYREPSKDGGHSRSDTYSDSEKHTRHRKRHTSTYGYDLDDDNSMRSESGSGKQASPSIYPESNTPNSIGPGNMRHDRENRIHSKRRRETQSDVRRREESDDSDISELGSVERTNNYRKDYRKYSKRKGTERKDRDGELICFLEHNSSPSIDDRWTGSYDEPRMTCSLFF